ncbi:MAG: TonB-dependent receptor [Bacteroidales bacterium]
MKQLKLFFTALFLFSISVAYAQNIKIIGVVSDASNGDTIPFASIIVKGTRTGISADENGNYSITAPANGTLIFSSIGYNNTEIAIESKLVVNAALTPDAVALDNVVVVAYGTAKKESLTGAVSSVGAKSIEKRPVTNAVSALEGMTSGVQINNTNGEPGSTPDIRIRGFTTINGSNSPLYVVDGVPLSGSTSDINSNDIESISILKDAASAALYGNRAANGVVLITTKRGKSEKFSLRASVQQGLYTRGIPEYDRLDADEWMEAQWKAIRNSYMSTPNSTYTLETAGKKTTSEFFETGIYNIYNKANNEVFDVNGKLTPGSKVKSEIAGDLDWYKPIERIGHRQDYNISADGAMEKVSYYFSVNFLDEKGYLKTSDFQRFTGRTNITYQPKKWLKLGFNMNGSTRESNSTSQSSGTGYANPFYFARNMAPIYPVHVHDYASADGAYMLDDIGNQIYDYGQADTRAQNSGRNAIYEGELNMERYYKNTLDAQAFVEISFLKDFKFTIKGDLYNSNSEERGYDNAIVGDGAASEGRASRTLYRYKNYTVQQQLTWGREFGKHNVDVLIGHENYSTRYNYLYGYKIRETIPGAVDFSNFAEFTSLTDYEYNYRTESYLSRARYNYDNKYFAEGSFRTDASSRFHPDNRWGKFWSLGGSWIISKENWMQGLSKQINSLKLRASYGQVGNDQSVAWYAYMALYGMTFNGKEAAGYKTQYAANDIKWESTNSLGVAVEGRFFDMFNLSVEYFDKRSKDLLFDVYLPLSSGSTDTGETTATVTRNMGTASNNGWELNFDIDAINRRDWKWNIGANATFLKNKIIELPEQNRAEGIISGTKKYVEGGGMFDYWLYQFVGVDQMTGNSLLEIDHSKYYGSEAEDNKTPIPAEYLVNVNGKDYTTYTTYAKKDWSGSSLPTVYGSINTNLSWKSLSFGAIITYSIGGKTYDNSYSSLMDVSNSPSAIHKDILKSWDGIPAGMTETSPNRIDPNGVPAIDGTLNTYNSVGTSTRWLQNSSYLVIKNINLSYSVPASFCRKLDLSRINLSLSVENLATITGLKGMDPQQAYGGVTSNYFSTARTFSLGINVVL